MDDCLKAGMIRLANGMDGSLWNWMIGKANLAQKSYRVDDERFYMVD